MKSSNRSSKSNNNNSTKTSHKSSSFDMSTYDGLETSDVSSFLKRKAFDAPDKKFFTIFDDNEKNIRCQAILENNIFACAQTIPNKKDEDRFVLCSSTDDILSAMAGFGVYDGHGGSYGSELCSDKFFEDVLKCLRRKLKLVSQLTNLEYNSLSEDIYDTLLGDSIREVTKELNTTIKRDSRTGTTAINLIFRLRTDGSYVAYCANTGDSRCVGHYMKKLVPMSEDHKLGNTEEVERINAGKTVSLRCLPIQFTNESPTEQNKKLYRKIYPSTEREKNAKKLHTIMKNIFEIAPTEDLRREIANVVDTMILLSIPSDASQDRISAAGDSSIHDSSVEGINHPLSSRSATITTAEAPQLNANLVTLIHPASTSTHLIFSEQSRSSANFLSDTTAQFPLNAPEAMDSAFDTHIDDDNEHAVMPIKHRQSFITSRSTLDGETTGPSALFSRHGVSMTMTRSIGDRHGARSAVCTPDITKLVVKPGQFARFIMGSDGIWDVISSEKAIAMTKNISDPVKAALHIVKRARKLREENHLYIDDITCLVADVNPSLNPALQASCFSFLSGMFE